MSKGGIIVTGLLFTAAFTVPVFRSGGRTHLTCFEWIVEHTIWGSPVQYVPEEDYARELEGAKIKRVGESEKELREIMAFYQISESSAKRLRGEE